jgi:hypothetical protein
VRSKELRDKYSSNINTQLFVHGRKEGYEKDLLKGIERLFRNTVTKKP